MQGQGHFRIARKASTRHRYGEYEVSSRVNLVKNNDAACAEPAVQGLPWRDLPARQSFAARYKDTLLKIA